MHSGGKTIQLNAGHYQAKIVTVGAGLAELIHHGRHVVIPHKPEEIPTPITAKFSSLPLTTRFRRPPFTVC